MPKFITLRCEDYKGNLYPCVINTNHIISVQVGKGNRGTEILLIEHDETIQVTDDFESVCKRLGAPL